MAVAGSVWQCIARLACSRLGLACGCQFVDGQFTWLGLLASPQLLVWCQGPSNLFRYYYGVPQKTKYLKRIHWIPSYSQIKSGTESFAIAQKPSTLRSFFTQMLFHTEALTQRRFSIQQLLHKRFQAPTLSHTGSSCKALYCTHRRTLLYAEAFTHTNTLLHLVTFTQRSVCTQVVLLIEVFPIFFK
jgi:hypothetical protein